MTCDICVLLFHLITMFSFSYSVTNFCLGGWGKKINKAAAAFKRHIVCEHYVANRNIYIFFDETVIHNIILHVSVVFRATIPSHRD